MLCRLLMLFIWVLIISMLFGMLLDGTQVLRPLQLEIDGDFIGLIRNMVRSREEDQCAFVRSEVMRKRSQFGVVRFGNWAVLLVVEGSGVAGTPGA